ncbi:MAG TPA: hypothetical protein VMT30_07995 [Candidatus Saccharimonadia bacterium]|nr:hypothetical protein [Candidatus Saccharimonadia bacterium]
MQLMLTAPANPAWRHRKSFRAWYAQLGARESSPRTETDPITAQKIVTLVDLTSPQAQILDELLGNHPACPTPPHADGTELTSSRHRIIVEWYSTICPRNQAGLFDQTLHPDALTPQGLASALCPCIGWRIAISKTSEPA